MAIISALDSNDDWVKEEYRKTSQPLLPNKLLNISEKDGYGLYPFHSLGSGKIFSGFDLLATWISEKKVVLLEGQSGMFWSAIQIALNEVFQNRGLRVKWFKTEEYLKDREEIEQLVAPFLGDPTSVWGKRCTGDLQDFFRIDQLKDLKPDENYDINVVIGVGATLVNWRAPVVYFDLPKNEWQYRMRAASAFNLGSDQAEAPSAMYKRAYFVDWVVLNRHKSNILKQIEVIVDGQRKDDINWMPVQYLRQGLQELSRSFFRVRPWFEPGAWGGQWMKNKIRGINQDVVNYAWSFELIVPENGLIFESGGNLLEVAFDFLMLQEYSAVLGRHAERFKTEFPIRFDFLDTYNGGNLSVQCHPSLPYIQKEFGENITQDETYYILDCNDEAKVYLGFQENINEETFREELEASVEREQKVDIEKHVQSHEARRHDLFLIPNCTVHSAGAGNLILEISATPYIFTFKMYDWLRLDLDGEPRPINIEHAFNNLNFKRKGEKVTQELISRPVTLDKGPDWKLVHLPTHPEHFYDVHRLEFDSEITVETEEVCHILMLVEGSSIAVETADGSRKEFCFSETFVVPAAANHYILRNLGDARAKVVKAFVKYERSGESTPGKVI